MTACCEGKSQCQRIKLLETLLLQVLRDAVAQDVLMEWWGPIGDALGIAYEGYDAALKRIDLLMDIDPEPDSAEGKELNSLCDMVRRYEEKEEDGDE